MGNKYLKFYLITAIIVIALALIFLFYPFQKDNFVLEENEILMENFSYNYKKDTSSNQVRGEWETLAFNYNESKINVVSEQTHPGPSYGQTSSVYKFRNDSSILRDIPGDFVSRYCTEEIKSPDNFYSYGTLSMNCSFRLILTVLKRESFSVCLIDEECTLVYGEDIRISS